jgi:hypothetical protein
MIKRIKKKYTMIVMSSVILVLGLIITAINVANYSSINALLDDKLQMLVDNEGLMPDLPFGEKPDDIDDPNDTENAGSAGDSDNGEVDAEGDSDSDELTGEDNGSGDQSPSSGDGSDDDLQSGEGSEDLTMPGENGGENHKT